MPPPPMPSPMGMGGEPSPGGSPALTPQANRGDQASADAKVQMAMRLLEDAMLAYGASSSKGRETLRALAALVKGHGREEDRAQAIMPAELKSALMANAAPPGAQQPPGQGPGGLPVGGPPGGGAAGGPPPPPGAQPTM